MEVLERVKSIVLEHLPEDHFIVDLSFKPNYGMNKLLIVLDGDTGVSIDVCSLISRKVGYHLEEENLIPEAYKLEVGSPGLDASFTDIRQYRKNIGREVKVKYNTNTVKIGLLEALNEEESILFHEKIQEGEKGRKAKYAPEKETIQIRDIVKINVVLTF